MLNMQISCETFCTLLCNGVFVRYPNIRYGNPNELGHYAQNVPIKDLARRLRRSERSVRDWLSGSKKVPFWVPELIRLQNLEHTERMRQMGMNPLRASLGLVTKTATVYEFPRFEPPPVVHVCENTLPLFPSAFG